MPAPSTVASTAPSVNGNIPDPLGKLGFVVEIPGVQIGRFAECSGLQVEYDVLEYEEGGNNMFVHRLRGRARYPTLTLSRGLTNEDGLLRWFFEYQATANRPDVTITIDNSAGGPVRRFAFASAFPIRWTGPDIAAHASEIGNESLEIGHTGLLA